MTQTVTQELTSAVQTSEVQSEFTAESPAQETKKRAGRPTKAEQAAKQLDAMNPPSDNPSATDAAAEAMLISAGKALGIPSEMKLADEGDVTSIVRELPELNFDSTGDLIPPEGSETSLSPLQLAEMQVFGARTDMADRLLDAFCEVVPTSLYREIMRRLRMNPEVSEADMYRAAQIMAGKTTREKHQMVSMQVTYACQVIRQTGQPRAINFETKKAIPVNDLTHHFIRKIAPMARRRMDS